MRRCGRTDTEVTGDFFYKLFTSTLHFVLFTAVFASFPRAFFVDTPRPVFLYFLTVVLKKKRKKREE